VLIQLEPTGETPFEGEDNCFGLLFEGEFDFSTIIVAGAGEDPSDTVISCNVDFPIIEIAQGNEIIFDNFQASNLGGPVLWLEDFSNVILSNLVIEDSGNLPAESLVAVNVFSFDFVSVLECEFVGNNGGLLIENGQGSLVLNSNFDNNVATTLPAGALQIVSTGSVAVQNCVFNENEASLICPALFVAISEFVSISECEFTKNVAVGANGGALSLTLISEADIFGSNIFQSNGADDGAAIWIEIVNDFSAGPFLSFVDNTATETDGAAISFASANAQFESDSACDSIIFSGNTNYDFHFLDSNVVVSEVCSFPGLVVVCTGSDLVIIDGVTIPC